MEKRVKRIQTHRPYEPNELKHAPTNADLHKDEASKPSSKITYEITTFTYEKLKVKTGDGDSTSSPGPFQECFRFLKRWLQAFLK
jgi:hypothetical protein